MYLYHIFVSEICINCSYAYHVCAVLASARVENRRHSCRWWTGWCPLGIHLYTCDNRASCCNNMCYKHPTGIPT